MSEQDIQRKIKKDLEALGCYVTKYNASAYGVSGHSDLIVGIPVTSLKDPAGFPICLYVEVKTKTGKVSIIQGIWHREREKEGLWVMVARSTQDVLDFLESKRVILR